MNALQVHKLDVLMQSVSPAPRHRFAGEDEPRAVLHVSLEVAHGYDDGNTYSAKFWTVETGYSCPDYIYLRSDGCAYVYDSEADKSHVLVRLLWEPRKDARYGWTLRSEVMAEALVGVPLS